MERPGTSGGSRPSTQGGIDKLSSLATRLRTPMYVSDRAMPGEAETISAIEVGGWVLRLTPNLHSQPASAPHQCACTCV